MEALLIYIGKSAIVLTLYALLFTTFLQNETFHRFKRFTLLSSILLAFALPLVNIGVEFPLTGLFTKEVPTATEINFTTLHAITNDSTLPTAVPATTFWNYTTLLATLYLTGMLILVVRLIAMYITLAHIIKRGEMREGTPGIELRVIDEEIKPFSWFRWVVISNSDLQECGKEIIIHESAHCNALHSLDIMIAEIVIILQWFNPFAWFVKKQLKEIHEYEADQAVLHSGTNIKKYQQLIIKKAVGARLYSIANSFNHSSTIKRITMMCKKKSNLWRCTKALYILPATAFAALLFSHPESINATEHESNGKVTDFTVNKQETMFAIATGDSTAKKIAAIGEVKHAEPNDTVWDNEQVYQVVEKMPQFPGGNEAMFAFLQKNIRYPQEARDAKAEGRSVIQFIVNRNGNINNVHIVKSSGNEALDKEAVRVVSSMPAWNPGKQRNREVKTCLTIPVSFKLQPLATVTCEELERVPVAFKPLPETKTTSEDLVKIAEQLNNTANEKRMRADKLYVKGDIDGARKEMIEAENLGYQAVQKAAEALRLKEEAEALKRIQQAESTTKSKPSQGYQKIQIPHKGDDVVISQPSPLLVINGAIYEGDAGIIANMIAEDIESISVLENETAVKIYGDKGKDGVIFIELKKHIVHFN